MERNLSCKFGRGYQEEQFCEFISNFGQWFRRGGRLKYFISEALVALLSVKLNHLCNFERGHHEEHLCEVI